MSEDVYWDACAWLGLINAEHGKVGPLEYFFGLAKRGQCKIWTSTVSYVEVFHLAGEVRPFPKDGLDEIKETFEQDFVNLIPLDMLVGRKARGLRRSHAGLNAADAIHLASALVQDITPLHTWDGTHLLPHDNNLTCRNGQQLRICRPEIPPPAPGTTGSLFEGT